MKKASLFLIVLIYTTFCYGQRQNNIWYFGDSAGISFNSGAPVALTNSAMLQVEGSAVISDTHGKLLFYTDGITVWNAANHPMLNGTGLLGNSSTTQSALIVPLPGSCSLYYLFTAPSEDTVTPLSYSIVDMTLNGGLGDVTIKNRLLRHPVTERLTATLDSAGTGYWIAAQDYNTNAIVCYHLTTAGFDTVPVISTFPALADTGGTDYILTVLGYMKFSPNGAKLCYTFSYYNNTSVLIDFNTATGMAINPIVLNQSAGGYGVEFSPDNSKLYIAPGNAPFVVWQYDLSAGTQAAIQNSSFLADSIPTDSSVQYGGALQLGPDGKIYADRLQGGFLDAITQPNRAGALCGYVSNAVNLAGKKCQDGLPNFIKVYAASNNGLDYQLGTANICEGDSTILTITSGLLTGISPASGAIKIDSAHYLLFPDSTALYVISGIDACNSNDTISALVNVLPTTVVIDPQTATICPGDSIKACVINSTANYTWNTGDTSTCISIKASGEYYVTAINNGQCPVASNHITVGTYTPTPVTISISGNALTAYSAESYQWFLNGVPINGATSQVFVARISGTYTLQITDMHGCTYFSAPVDMDITGIGEELTDDNISIFPNPSNGVWQVSVNTDLLGARVEIFSLDGQQVYSSVIVNMQTTITLPTEATGIYELRISYGEKNFVRKLVKI